jgi:hypothetical protein
MSVNFEGHPRTKDKIDMARKSIPVTLSILLIGGFALVGHAGVAQAASQTVTQDCMSNVTIPIALAIGETLTINTDPSGYCSNAGTFAGSGIAPQGVGIAKYGATGTENTLPYNFGTSAFTYGTRIIYTATAEGSIRIQMENDVTMSELTYYDITVTAASGGGTDPSSDTRALNSGLCAVLQQVGLPADGCESVQDSQLNWSGVPFGGWSISWAEWVNGGKGGAVCTRTLTYSSATGAWLVKV